MTSRRTALKILGFSALGTGAYSYHRGIRIPPLRWEPQQPKKIIKSGSVRFVLSDLIQTKTAVRAETQYSFRAYSPQPSLKLSFSKNQTLKISINNISEDASLEISGIPKSNVREETIGITRFIEIKALDGSLESAHLHWRLTNLGNYSFASIGDTGGDKELAWCIHRAEQLGARFLLHLGDFNYQESDYKNAIQLFNESPIPCYVAIGNHDFHMNGPIYDQFLSEIGPFNSAFSIGSVRYINIDTASNTLPYNAGHRGKLFAKLAASNSQFKTTIAFTHRPLFDPEPDRNHDIGSENERDWLIGELQNVNASTLFSGHIHIKGRGTISGIDNIIVGQGLGHQDLLTNSDYSKIALGTVNSEGNLTVTLEPLSMPMELHCHPRVEPVKQALRSSEHAELIKSIDLQCKT